MAIVTALGLAAILTRFDGLMTALRYAGSLYLIWLGVSMIRDSETAAYKDLLVDRVDRWSFSTIVWQGVLVEFLNPKTVLFFALFLPQFVQSSGAEFGAGNVQLQLLILGALVPLTAVPSDLVVAYLGGSIAQRINRQRLARKLMGWTGGLILLLIAVNLNVKLF